MKIGNNNTQDLILLGSWFILSSVVASIGERKGINYWLTLVLAIVLSPLVGICIVSVLEGHPVQMCETCKNFYRLHRFNEGCTSCKGCEEAFERGYM